MTPIEPALDPRPYAEAAEVDSPFAKSAVAPADDQATDIDILVNREEFDALQRDLDQALAKADEHWKLYLGAHAEMENLRKRTERDVQNAHKFALERFFNELLPVRDSLELGLTAANGAVDIAQLREGVELTLKQLAAAMEKFGVREVNPLNAKFDPHLHEAMAMAPTDQAEPNTVIQVVQKGYILNERLIRPAKVIVAQARPAG
ncbi:MAG TPA: nucleotide exchange factor GrpE [Candidatus Competibacteraceae bacterium]|nr:nucleotide exchange factor GrpE [Candidatus Competibacteraceae bacterium]HRZ04865.1 nucleotide exchange factor GrpE [Candidatus Competibacteraceae bacterium]HSA46757.1 nucleotide exchange factor GrpE [Candidatus Competibacteraceae bacterium]